MTATGARNKKCVLVYQKTRGIWHRVFDLILHVALTLSRVSWYHNLEGDISLAMHIISHPDNRETTMAQLVVYAIPVGKDVPDAGRIVRAPGVKFWIFCYFVELVFIL
jgi:hypothetical protein